MVSVANIMNKYHMLHKQFQAAYVSMRAMKKSSSVLHEQ